MTTRKTFAQLMNEAFVTEDPAATTATTDEAPPLTAATILDAIRLLRANLPVVYYIASEHVEDATAVYRIPSKYAQSGYNLVCHPGRVSLLRVELSGQCVLLPMDDAESQRREKLMKKDLWTELVKRLPSPFIGKNVA